MKNKALSVWKPFGATPLDVVLSFKKARTEYLNKKISYAGRLDPMAEGVLVLLVGDENKKRKEYESLKKEYEVEIVFGVKTDTFDALGLIEGASLKIPNRIEVLAYFRKLPGKQKQKYPPYSSKAVNGKPLYWWARQNKISEIEIPEREIEIYKIDVGKFSFINVKTLAPEMIKKIKMVGGDFRQKEIIDGWRGFEKKNKGSKLLKIKIKISCSGGTYVRRLASDIGEDLGCGAFALAIKRTRVGKYVARTCLRV